MEASTSTSQRVQRRRLLFPWLAAIPFALGLVLLGIGFYVTVLPSLTTLVTADWAETPCEITRSEAVEHVSRHKGKTTQYTVATIEYTYTVEGRAYESDRIDYYPTTDQRRVLRRFRPGANQCYVDPAHPERAVLLSGGESREISGPSLSSLTIAVGWLIAFLVPGAILSTRPREELQSASDLWSHWSKREVSKALASLVPGVGVVFGVQGLAAGDRRFAPVYLLFGLPWLVFLTIWVLFLQGVL